MFCGQDCYACANPLDSNYSAQDNLSWLSGPTLLSLCSSAKLGMWPGNSSCFRFKISPCKARSFLNPTCMSINVKILLINSDIEEDQEEERNEAQNKKPGPAVVSRIEGIGSKLCQLN